MHCTTNRFRRGTNIVEVAAFTLLLVVFGGVVACGTGVTDAEPTPKPKASPTPQGGGDATPVGKTGDSVDESGSKAGGASDGRSGGASGMPGAGKREADDGAKAGNGDAATVAQPADGEAVKNPEPSEDPDAKAKRDAAAAKLAKILGGARAKLDETCLSEYYKYLSLNLQDGGENKIRRNYTETKRGADLLQWLVRKEVVKASYATRLAGASGTEGSEEDWKSEVPIDATKRCIFTCPADGQTFANRATAKNVTDGVFMCYNRYYFDKYPEDGMVMIMAGMQKAMVVKFVDVPGLVAESKTAAVTPSVGDASFFGKYPFEKVAGE